MTDIGLRHLQLVVSAAKHGSFRHAAAVMNIRQSTISRAIRHVEERLGVILFLRSPAGVKPTQTGSQFLTMAERVLTDFQVLLTQAQEMGRGIKGHLVLGLSASHAATRLQPTFLAYALQCPGINIMLATSPKATLLAELKAGVMDLAIIAGRVIEPGIRVISLWSERILLAVPESHAFAARSYVDWTDLRDERVLTSSQESGPELKQMLLAKLGSLTDKFQVEEHSVRSEALVSLVAAGRGICLHGEGNAPSIYFGVRVLEVHDATGPTWITYSACENEHNTSPALASFLALLRAHYSTFSPIGVADT